MKTDAQRSVILGLAALALISLSGCGSFSLDDYNPFSEREEKLPGVRKPFLTDANALAVDESAKAVPALPAAVENGNWSQPGGNSANAPGHLAFAASPKVSFRVGAVRGSSDELRLSNPPIIYQGRVYVMDTAANVVAFSTAGGRAWSVPLRPEGESEDGIAGGGLAADDGKLFAATGYGIVYALDPASGKQLWNVNLNMPIRSAPTAAAGKVFVVTSDNRVVALNAGDGAQAWDYRGIQETTGVLGAASPAVSGDLVVVPYSSGEITAFKASSGDPVWAEALIRSQQFTSVSGISDVAARPVIDNGLVYAVSVSGRMVAVDLRTGDRVWQRNLASSQMPVSAGQTVYVVDLSGQLVALSRSGGQVRWVTQLPGGRKVRWNGPVLAGGQLWLTSSEGILAAVNAISGQITSQTKLGDPTYMAPVVAGGRMYVLTDKGGLLGLN